MDIKNNNQYRELPTCKQLERAISQNFYACNRQTIGYSPQKINCTIFENYLVIVGEEAITPLESTIRNSGRVEILREVRRSINQALQSQLEKSIKNIAKVEVIDSICQLNFDTGRLMAIALLQQPPQTRSKKISRKVEKHE